MIASSLFLATDTQPKTVQCMDGTDVAWRCRLEQSVLDHGVVLELDSKDRLLACCCIRMPWSWSYRCANTSVFYWLLSLCHFKSSCSQKPSWLLQVIMTIASQSAMLVMAKTFMVWWHMITSCAIQGKKLVFPKNGLFHSIISLSMVPQLLHGNFTHVYCRTYPSIQSDIRCIERQTACKT